MIVPKDGRSRVPDAMKMSEFRNQNDHPVGEQSPDWGDYYNDAKERANASVFIAAFGGLEITLQFDCAGINLG
jgi:hypothetical protein